MRHACRHFVDAYQSTCHLEVDQSNASLLKLNRCQRRQELLRVLNVDLFLGLNKLDLMIDELVHWSNCVTGQTNLLAHTGLLFPNTFDISIYSSFTTDDFFATTSGRIILYIPVYLCAVIALAEGTVLRRDILLIQQPKGVFGSNYPSISIRYLRSSVSNHAYLSEFVDKVNETLV